ncbi:MAG: hypothetical protein QXD51_03595, partial [Candidatus Anstonellales archaeon]
PLDLRTQGGKMCYDVSAWDYAGWQSSAKRVCVDIPPSGPIDEVPEIIWVAIYEGVGGIGEGGGEELQAKESTSKVEEIVGSVSSQNPTSVILLAQPGYEGGVLLSPPPGESGDMYTRIANVRVRVMAVNAEQCMLGNDGPAGGQPVWSGTWIDYNGDPTTYTWTLRDVEGERTVFVKCKNSFGESAIASDTITYDHTPPIFLDNPAAIYEEAGWMDSIPGWNQIRITWKATDEKGQGIKVSGIKEYNITKYKKGFGGKGGEAWELVGSWKVGGASVQFVDRQFEGGKTYKYLVTPTDNAGNTAPGVYTNEITPPKDPILPPGEDKEPPYIQGMPIAYPANLPWSKCTKPICVCLDYSGVSVNDPSGIKTITVTRIRDNKLICSVKNLPTNNECNDACQTDNGAMCGDIYRVCACDNKENCNPPGCVNSNPLGYGSCSWE